MYTHIHTRSLWLGFHSYRGRGLSPWQGKCSLHGQLEAGGQHELPLSLAHTLYGLVSMAIWVSSGGGGGGGRGSGLQQLYSIRKNAFWGHMYLTLPLFIFLYGPAQSSHVHSGLSQRCRWLCSPTYVEWTFSSTIYVGAVMFLFVYLFIQ
jgi:hypothetical protein